MKIKKLLIMLPMAFYVVKNLGTLIRLKKEAEKYKKVRDHCHFTGRYRGCAI